jgi:uncharacterized protein (DUF58 family)
MKLSDIDKDTVLEMLGLTTRPSVAGRAFGVVGLFGLGLLACAALGLLLAPQPGAQLRAEVSRRLKMGNDRDPDGKAIDELVT